MIKRSFLNIFFIIASLTMHTCQSMAPNTIIGNVSDPSTTFNAPVMMAMTPNGAKAYVLNVGNDTISIIDVATNTTTGTVNQGIFSFSGLFSVAFTPDGTKAYVTNSTGNKVSVINVATDTVVSEVVDGGGTLNNPQGIVITPDGTKAYVSNFGSSTVSIIDVATNTISLPAIVGFDGPQALAVSPDGAKVYVANFGNGMTVDIIDVASNTRTGGIASPNFNNPVSIAFSPDGTKAYIVNNANSSVSIVNVATDTATGLVASPNFSSPASVAFLPDGTTAYVPNFFNGTLSIIGVATNTATGIASDPNTLLDGPVFIAIAPSGLFAYIANIGGSVSILFIASSPESGVLPPNSAQGCKTKNKFLTQTDFINYVTWTAPTSGTTPTQYKIYRNASLTDLVATVPATSTLQYFDHNRNPKVTYSYYIVSVDAQGNASTARTFTVSTCC